jgi:hypothetical protein
MKRFSFVAGHKADASSGMVLEIDRSSLPAETKLGLWLDDDGRALPGRGARVATEAVAQQAALVFEEGARIRTRFGGIVGTLTLAPGTRFDADPATGPTTKDVRGARVALREGRRFADLHEPLAALHLDKQPHGVHVFTLEAERPPGAKPGDRHVVHVTQKTREGVTVGGISVEFVFD